jgi:hypothetical protein
MPAHLTGRTVRVLIGTEPTNLVTPDVSEVKVTSEARSTGAGARRA